MAIIWTKLIPRWDGLTIEPPEAKKDTGYIAGDKPPAKWENWLRKGTYEALDETRDVIEGIDLQVAQKATQIDLSNHLGDLITDSNGVHGLKIESGVWTPVMAGGTTAGTFTGTAIGAYKLIGKQVTCYFMISGTIVGASGELNLRGLPFIPISGELSGIMTRNNFVSDRILAINNTGSVDILRITQGGTSLVTVTTSSTTLDFWGSVDYFIN